MKHGIRSGALALVILASLCLLACSKPGYLDVIETNWDVAFPGDGEEVFGASAGLGFHGDGERYHVYRYGGFDGLEPLLSWQDVTVYDGGDYPSAVCEAVEGAEEHLPQPGAYKRSRLTQADGSSVVFLFSLEHNLLYVFESFM